jgi:hypothetical protein
MDRPIRAIEWQPPGASAARDVTNAIETGVVSATPHPDDAVDDPKGYSVKLTLTADAEAFADELQDALLSVDPAAVTVHLDDIDAPIEDVPVGVTKVPYPGEQNDAELSVKPEGHAQFHPHF